MLFEKKIKNAPLSRGIIAAAAIVAVYFFGATGIAYAQPEPIKNAREAVMVSIEKLEELKGSSLRPVEKLRKEIDLKREALTNIVRLSRLETETIKAKLDALEADPPFAALKKELVDKIKNYLNYFTGLEEVLKSTNNLDGIQSVAGQLKDWRKFTYDPEITKAVDFILVFQNREVLDTGGERLEKISGDLKRKAATAKSLWQPVVAKAATNLNVARELNARAFALLASYLPKSSAIDIPEIMPPTDEKTSDVNLKEVSAEAIITKPATIRDLVQDSLLEIKEAYQRFVELNDFLKR